MFNLDKVEKFARMKSDWWDQSGQNAALHSLNALRIGFIDEIHKGIRGLQILPFFLEKILFQSFILKESFSGRICFGAY